MANFTARTTFNSLSKENAPIILRSSIGLYAASIPQRLLVHSIYIFFLLCLLSFWEIANPTAVSMTVSLICVALFVFVIISFTSISRLIMLNGAMGHDEILSQDKEEKLSTKQLSDHLLKQASLAKKAKIPINYQYRVRYHQVLEDVEMGRVPVPLQREFLDAQKESKRDAAAMKLKSHSLYKGDFPSSIDYDRDATIIPADFEVEIKAEE